MTKGDVNLYVVIEAPGSEQIVADTIPSAERCEIRDRVWFVASSTDTSNELAERLRVDGKSRSAIIVSARFKAGYAESSVIEKLESWRA